MNPILHVPHMGAARWSARCLGQPFLANAVRVRNGASCPTMAATQFDVDAAVRKAFDDFPPEVWRQAPPG